MRDHRDLPAFQAAHDLLLAVHEATHRLPTSGEPGGLAVRLRAASLSTAGTVVRGSGLPGRRFAGELEHAACRLREIGYYIPATTEKTAKRCVKTGSGERCKVAIQTNNVDVDDRGYVYIVDRANTGLHILELLKKD